jgi:hypothetical protein
MDVPLYRDAGCVDYPAYGIGHLGPDTVAADKGNRICHIFLALDFITSNPPMEAVKRKSIFLRPEDAMSRKTLFNHVSFVLNFPDGGATKISLTIFLFLLKLE